MNNSEGERQHFYRRIVEHLSQSANLKRALIAGAYSPGGILAVAAASEPRIAGERVPASLVGSIFDAAEQIATAFHRGGKLLLCGNGGSAADCQHMATEFMNLLSKKFNRGPLPAIALTTDTSFLTAFGNDFKEFEGVFARQVEALGKAGDVLVAISTSGTSPNVIAAAAKARASGMKTIALTGEGGALANLADVGIAVPSTNTHHIQEAHLAIEHAICITVETLLFGKRGAEDPLPLPSSLA